MKKDNRYFCSVFHTCERVAAQMMVDQGKATKIPVEQIPTSVLYNDHGEKASFAVWMFDRYRREFEELIADLRM